MNGIHTNILSRSREMGRGNGINEVRGQRAPQDVHREDWARTN